MIVPKSHITLEEASRIAGKDPETYPPTLRRAISRGRLKAERIGTAPGGVWVTTREDLERYLKNRWKRG